MEIGTRNAVKKYIFCLACAITAFESSGAIFYNSGGQVVGKTRIQVLVEYQVPTFEMVISFKLKLEYGNYGNYAYHWNPQGIMSLKSGK